MCQERHFAWALWRLKSLVHRLFVKHSFRLPRRKAGGLPSQRACTAENVSMSWYHCGFDSSPPGWNGTKIADDNFKCNWETWVNGHTVTHFGRCQATTQLNYSGYQLQLTHPWLNKIFSDIIKWIFSNANILILSKTSWQSSSMESMDKKSTLYGSWLSTKRNLMLNCVLTRHQNLMGGWFHLGPVTHV